LDAGPIVIILTGLFAIFKYGLGDNENTDGISAYSVFNKGFQKLMGSVDVEALVAQHVGGGMAGFAQMPGGFDDGQADHRHVAAVARPRRPQVEEEGDNDDDDDDNNQEDNGQVNHENVARKSGKKARRRNLEQRQEVKRQREAAMALGLQDDGGPEDVVAIQRLIEEQLAAERAADN
jgi:hypothetical protein